MNSEPQPAPRDATEQFLRLLSTHERRISAFVLALVPHWADADEIVQETKIRLWQQFENYRAEEDFGAWACTIAKFQVMTHRKRTGRERVRFSEDFADAMAQQITQSRNVGMREAALSQCLEKLSDKNREIVRRYYAGESKIDDIARELSRTASAVYKSIAASRKFLHGCVESMLLRDVAPDQGVADGS